VRLLGRPVRLVADLQMPYAERRLILSAISAALRKLDAEHAAGVLSETDRSYLGALKRFAFGRGRSGQDCGVFIFGLADVRATADAEYWSSALVHDGVHAVLQARGRRYLDEVAPCDAQIDYLARTGGAAALIQHVERFRDSRSFQRSRFREGV
jgi:hypothetical protein